MVKQQDFELMRGDTQYITVTFTDADTELPIDITGYEIFLTIKKLITDADDDAVFELTVDTFDYGPEGYVVLKIPDTATYDLVGNYYYDVQSKNLNADITTVLYGTMTFNKDVTRRTV